jgi:hypothetical protein
VREKPDAFSRNFRKPSMRWTGVPFRRKVLRVSNQNSNVFRSIVSPFACVRRKYSLFARFGKLFRIRFQCILVFLSANVLIEVSPVVIDRTAACDAP